MNRLWTGPATNLFVKTWRPVRPRKPCLTQQLPWMEYLFTLDETPPLWATDLWFGFSDLPWPFEATKGCQETCTRGSCVLFPFGVRLSSRHGDTFRCLAKWVYWQTESILLIVGQQGSLSLDGFFGTQPRGIGKEGSDCRNKMTCVSLSLHGLHEFSGQLP